MHVIANKPDTPNFIRQQQAFTARVRDPDNVTLPAGVDARRMAVYEELVYNNVEEFLRHAYPVLRRISSDEQWHQRVRNFLRLHRAQTPLFPEMPREFLLYLEQHEAGENDFPFLLELAHYEWAELALSISEAEIDETGLDAEGSLLQGIPVLSPLLWLCSYRFPVHRISPEFIPEQPQQTQTHLLVYRNREHRVGFLELNPVTARLLQRLEQNETKSGEALLRELAEEMQHPKPQTVIEGGLQLLQELMRRDVILGVTEGE